MVCLSRPYPFKLFKGCFPQILLGPLLHTLSHVILAQSVAECSRFLVFEDVDCAMLFLIHFRASLLNIIFNPYPIFYSYIVQNGSSFSLLLNNFYLLINVDMSFLKQLYVRFFCVLCIV